MKILKIFYYASAGFSIVIEFINNVICKALSFILERIFKSKKLKINDFFIKMRSHPEYLLIASLYLITIISIYNLIVPKKTYIEEIKKIDYQDVYTTPSATTNESVIDNSESNSDNSNNNTYEYSNNIDLNSYKIQNNDTVAYLIVDGTTINYPVVQTNDNKYYLEHDFYHKYSLKGAIFADYRDDFNNLLNNTIIYGHHRLDNTMFGQIDRLFTTDYFSQSNHIIKLITFDKTYIFEVFSVYEIEPEVYYLTTFFNNNSDYLSFLNTIKNRSQYDFEQPIDSNSKILTLSTCNTSNTGRLVVHAVLKGE